MPAYGTDAGLAQYATDTGRTVSGTPATLRQYATDYVDGVYWWQFKGSPLTDDNAFPRIGSTTVPERVERATYEAALIYDADPSALTSGGTSIAGGGAVASEKVDVISVSYHGPNAKALTDDTVLDNVPRYDVIENILRPLLNRWQGASAAAFVV